MGTMKNQTKNCIASKNGYKYNERSGINIIAVEGMFAVLQIWRRGNSRGHMCGLLLNPRILYSSWHLVGAQNWHNELMNL